ncbi:toll/interleukin-1 receptor domain-containing protein [Streptomyces sp. NBC_00878]|uniref:toll/interleukin-1 receptor domain-containing protein n=1 Tax=Streptomyces sp. NBC_00878 TaxID=2975854 RepID=UPI00225518CD|nr:toll/interleukin-1 receptor domain-containing protein [Streptomyces sp. NBC_00878]MCX4905856.1 toll/interleukin-1 receptor domain-containing protein [Streptomyces sp. NBC_00878]
MSTWHASNSAEWTPVGSRMITGHGGGMGPYDASYVIDLSSGPLLNGSVSAAVRLTDRGATGAGVVCRADRDWTFVAFYTAPDDPSEDTTVARLGVFQEGVLTPVAQLAEPVRLAPGYNRFTLEFFSGRIRGEIRAGDRTYELTALCPHIPFPGHTGLVKFYGAGVLAKSWSVEQTRMPFVAAGSRPAKGKDYPFDVFLCYASDTAEEVQAIAKTLAARGVSYWLDSNQINYGQRISVQIEAGLRSSRYLLPCISKNIAEREWTRAEFGGVLNAEFGGGWAPVTIPVLLADAEPDDIPFLVRDTRWVSSTNKVAFDEFISFVLSH